MSATELRVARRALRWRILFVVVALSTLMMVVTVSAVDGHWVPFVAASTLLVFGLGYAGTEGYRLRAVGSRRVDVHAMLRVKRLDLSQGFEVRARGLGPAALTLRAGGRRARVTGAIGASATVEEWLRAAAE